MAFIPLTADERQEMLAARSASTRVDELFADIPDDVRFPHARCAARADRA